MLCSVAAGAGAAPGASAGSESEIVYVVAGGWHTELDLPRAAIGGRLTGLAVAFSGAPYLVFGWGARDYYMARHPGIADLLRAAAPGPAVVLVAPLTVPPGAFAGPGNVRAVALSREGGRRLAQFLWESLAKDANGAPRPLGAGPYPHSVFYAASGGYDLSHTCNTWTAEALQAAGVPVSATGVVFAGQLLDQLGR
jgi:uncharacterized protein (TIGR02117 family)